MMSHAVTVPLKMDCLINIWFILGWRKLKFDFRRIRRKTLYLFLKICFSTFRVSSSLLSTLDRLVYTAQH